MSYLALLDRREEGEGSEDNHDCRSDDRGANQAPPISLSFKCGFAFLFLLLCCSPINECAEARGQLRCGGETFLRIACYTAPDICAQQRIGDRLRPITR